MLGGVPREDLIYECDATSSFLSISSGRETSQAWRVLGGSRSLRAQAYIELLLDLSNCHFIGEVCGGCSHRIAPFDLPPPTQYMSCLLDGRHTMVSTWQEVYFIGSRQPAKKS